MNIDNQNEYWDKVAQQKTFTHPVNIDLLGRYMSKDAEIIDYGCGYGRIVNELIKAGFKKTTGYDTSAELIKRGKKDGLPLYHISSPPDLPASKNSIDCILLFAVLTCIPSNKGQQALLQLLHSLLKPGGIIYISDYYLRQNETAAARYTFLNNDPDNFGVFNLPEGVSFRHHSREWILTLVADFYIRQENAVEVKTMNGHVAEAFQLIIQK